MAVISDRESGLSYKELSAKHNVGLDTVRNWIARAEAGLPPGGSRRAIQPVPVPVSGAANELEILRRDNAALRHQNERLSRIIKMLIDDGNT